MFGSFHQFLGPGGNVGVFNAQFRAFSAIFLPGNERENVNYGSKVILPPSALARLSNLHIEYPMLFEISHTAKNKLTHGGVLEFVAEEGRCYLPRWMMRVLHLQEGELVTIKNTALPLGTFVKLQPQSVEFLDIYDPRAVLEQAFRSYSTLTKEDIITISYNNNEFDLLVLEVKPADAVSIIETDLEVDFAPPVGYVEPERQPISSNSGFHSTASMKSSIMSSIQHLTDSSNTKKVGWDTAGGGERLGGRFNALNDVKGKGQENQSLTHSDVGNTVNSRHDPTAPLRLPLGVLFFGFDKPFYTAEDESTKSSESKPHTFIGEGNTLRKSRK